MTPRLDWRLYLPFESELSGDARGLPFKGEIVFGRSECFQAKGSPASEMRAVCTNLADSEERVGKKKLITSVRERDQKQGDLGSWQRWPLDTQLLLKHSWSHSLWESEWMLSKKDTVMFNHLFPSFICKIICFPLYCYLQIKKQYLRFSFKLYFIKAL